MILSMTVKERQNPSILNPSRKRRIANGAGVDISEVNRLVKQFEQSRKMMKQMQGSVAGGMGKNVKIPETMMAMIARQPLKKLLAQGGIDADGEQAKMLAAALGKIPKK